MIKLFTKYCSVGMINTAIHWIVFALSVYVFSQTQALSNVIAFCVAVTFSFFINARFTFNASATALKYIGYISFMGMLSLGTGKLADSCRLPPLVTLITFSALSLICGFLFSHLLLFKNR
ncbi:GtrA family protein [Musicola paradisiaca]|uniref:Bactoprenol-linked glucose translocase n=1 Tax=Musicola paradisiaca (strain Ech703) TaxID=579405 RepID=C6C6M6_MUSP7|nr:GtrA family protein [Musicola paradisiaca]ACS83945.1 GtrA family protein [Musicola paradisiaca Ech703]